MNFDLDKLDVEAQQFKKLPLAARKGKQPYSKSSKLIPVCVTIELEARRANPTAFQRVYKKKPSTIAYEFPEPAREKPAKYVPKPAEPTVSLLGKNSGI